MTHLQHLYSLMRADYASKHRYQKLHQITDSIFKVTKVFFSS